MKEKEQEAGRNLKYEESQLPKSTVVVQYRGNATDSHKATKGIVSTSTTNCYIEETEDNASEFETTA